MNSIVNRISSRKQDWSLAQQGKAVVLNRIFRKLTITHVDYLQKQFFLLVLAVVLTLLNGYLLLKIASYIEFCLTD